LLAKAAATRPKRAKTARILIVWVDVLDSDDEEKWWVVELVCLVTNVVGWDSKEWTTKE
jgi:hypothetical protein